MRTSLAIYVTMSLVAVAIAWARTESLFFRDEAESAWPMAGRVALSLGLGVAIGWATVVGTRHLVRRYAWGRAMRAELRAVLGPIEPGTALVAALGSGIAEELFFRGALQPWIGWALASLFFGLLHIGRSRALLPWTVSAVVMGFVFGAIYSVTGVIFGCVLAHVLINFVNLIDLGSFDAAVDAPAAPAPTLIQRPRTRATS